MENFYVLKTVVLFAITKICNFLQLLKKTCFFFQRGI